MLEVIKAILVLSGLVWWYVELAGLVKVHVAVSGISSAHLETFVNGCKVLLWSVVFYNIFSYYPIEGLLVLLSCFFFLKKKKLLKTKY